MATLEQKIEAERHAREMLEQGGLPQPDWIEYGYTCIRLLWTGPKVVLVVEIDEPPEDFDPAGVYLDDLDADEAILRFGAFSDSALETALEVFDEEAEEAA